MTRAWLVGQWYRAVLEVLDGSPVSEVAVPYGVWRQSVYSWKARHAVGGIDELRETSRRTRTSPSRLAAETEALVCELRRAHPRWGPRIAFEVAQRNVAGAPSRATVHRVPVRNAMATPQAHSTSGSTGGGSGRRRWHCGSWTCPAGSSRTTTQAGPANQNLGKPAWWQLEGNGADIFLARNIDLREVNRFARQDNGPCSTALNFRDFCG